MTRRTALLAALAMVGCVASRPLGARVSVASPSFPVPGATAAVPLVSGGVVRFASRNGSVVVTLPGGSTRSDAESLADARGVTAGKTQAGNELVVERGTTVPVALSNPVE